MERALAALSVAAAARARPDAIAVVTPDETLRYVELAERAAGMAAALARLDPGPVAFVATARVSTVALVAALLEVGRPFVPLHPRWAEAERTAALAALDASGAIHDGAVIVDPAELGRTSAGPVETIFASARARETDLAVCLFTSGSAGAPKAVLLERGALVASACAHAANLPFLPDDRWLALMPLAHAGGLSIVTRALASRTAIVLGDRFDPKEAIETIAQSRVTLASFVPAMLAAMLDAGGERALASLRGCLVGGAGFPSGLRDRARRAGVRALATYGLTETASQIATQRTTDPIADDPAVVGPPLAGVEIEIRDAGGARVEPGVTGRVFVRGPMLMRGYAGQPARARSDWLDTNDLGSLDEGGALRILGRADDTIVTGGENVHPTEVEAVIARQRGARACAVFGVPDDVWGAVVALVLVVEPGADAHAICRAAASELASFKRPRLVAVVEALPLSPNGKLDRRSLGAWSSGRLVAVDR